MEVSNLHDKSVLGFPSRRCCEAAGSVLCTFARSFKPLDLCGTFAIRNRQVLIVIMLSSRLGTMSVSYLKWLGLPTKIRLVSRFIGSPGTASPRAASSPFEYHPKVPGFFHAVTVNDLRSPSPPDSPFTGIRVLMRHPTVLELLSCRDIQWRCCTDPKTSSSVLSSRCQVEGVYTSRRFLSSCPS